MTTLLQAIGEILRPHLLLRGPLVLEETGEKNSCKPITFLQSGRAFALRPDYVCSKDSAPKLSASDRLFPLFDKSAGLAAMCDYVVFCEGRMSDEARLFVLLCELKSKNIQGSRQQIENGKLLVDYILSMAKHHRVVQPLPTVEYRALVFSPAFAVPKGSLHKQTCKYTHFPDGFSDMPFAHYGCGREYPISHFCA